MGALELGGRERGPAAAGAAGLGGLHMFFSVVLWLYPKLDNDACAQEL